MNLCLTLTNEVYDDDKRETFNSLLRVKTPFPKRDDKEELAVKVASCACAPIKCLEGIGMMTCGMLLWLIPCTICKIKTNHSGTDVSLKSVSPGIRRPNIPCYFKDEYEQGDRVTETTGYLMSCYFNKHSEGHLNDMTVVSSATGYNFLSSGIVKIFNALLSMVCCPITVSSACCKKIDC